VVSTYSQLLEQLYRDKLDAQASTIISYIVDSVKRMYSLIDALLSYSQLGARPLALEPVDCGEVLNQALQNLATSVRETGAQVECGVLPVVKGDRPQLLQLFQNLIGNALKYRSERPPLIRVAATEHQDRWELSVQDNGIGIPKESYDRIFHLFQRLHSKEEYAGTGIGLAVCKKIAERHGGSLWLESEVDKGTTFFFTLRKEGK
jgi:two-component system, chemotaxis family, sensor kinase Cph1